MHSQAILAIVSGAKANFRLPYKALGLNAGLSSPLHNSSLDHKNIRRLCRDLNYAPLDKLLSSQWVEVKAYQAADGSLVAASIERHDTEVGESASLQGPVEESTQPNFTIIGIKLVTDNSTEFGAGGIFPQVGEVVEAEGLALVSDGVFTAAAVERED